MKNEIENMLPTGLNIIAIVIKGGKSNVKI